MICPTIQRRRDERNNLRNLLKNVAASDESDYDSDDSMTSLDFNKLSSVVISYTEQKQMKLNLDETDNVNEKKEYKKLLFLIM